MPFSWCGSGKIMPAYQLKILEQIEYTDQTISTSETARLDLIKGSLGEIYGLKRRLYLKGK